MPTPLATLHGDCYHSYLNSGRVDTILSIFASSYLSEERSIYDVSYVNCLITTHFMREGVSKQQALLETHSWWLA